MEETQCHLSEMLAVIIMQSQLLVLEYYYFEEQVNFNSKS